MQRLLPLLLILLIPATSHAAITDLQDMMENLRSILTPAMRMLLAVSFIVGLVFMLRGLMILRSFSLPLTQATKPGEVSGPLVYIFVGAVMVYIPTSTDVLTATLFGSGTPSIFDPGGSPDLSNMGSASSQIMGYAPIAIESQWASLIDTVVLYVQFIGFIAFLRGWIIVASAGQPGVQPGSISRGLTHIIGGILAINFLPLVDAVQNTILRGS